MTPAEIINSWYEIFDSLNSSISDAGGTPFNVATLKSLTAYELLCILATNNIRFYYKES